jgi:hypothetical protein
MLIVELVNDASQRRRAGALAVAVLAAAPLAAVAAPRHDRVPARISAPSAGVVYAGVTPQGFPVMVEVNKSGRQVVRAAAGINVTCVSGLSFALPAGWSKLTIRQRAFNGSFGPETETNPDGTTLEVEEAVNGKFNSSRSRVSGRWSLKITSRDAAGTVLDTCDSGSVSWTAKQ